MNINLPDHSTNVQFNLAQIYSRVHSVGGNGIQVTEKTSQITFVFSLCSYLHKLGCRRRDKFIYKIKAYQPKSNTINRIRYHRNIYIYKWVNQANIQITRYS